MPDSLLHAIGRLILHSGLTLRSCMGRPLTPEEHSACRTLWPERDPNTLDAYEVLRRLAQLKRR